MISARSEACPQGLLGSGIRELIRTSAAHGHVFLLQLNTNAERRLTAAWRYCSSYIKALQLLLLSIYQSWKKNHQSVKFHLKSLPVYSSISQTYQIKVQMRKIHLENLDGGGKVLLSAPHFFIFFILFTPAPFSWILRRSTRKAHEAQG